MNDVNEGGVTEVLPDARTGPVDPDPAVATRRFLTLAAPALLVAVAAWVALIGWGGSKDMRRGLLTGGPALMSMHHMGEHMHMEMGPGPHRMLGFSMDGAVTSPKYLVAFAVMWTVMVLAMMLPSMLPALREYLATEADSTRAGAGFLAAVVVLWAVTGAVVYGLLIALYQLWDDPGDTALRVAAVMVLAVALFQFSRAKDLMLTHVVGPFCCGSPNPFSAGFRHGLRCVASCGPWMVLVALIGMMSVFWMALFAVVMLAEQVLEIRAAKGVWLSRAVGATTVVVALALVSSPGVLPLVA